MNRCLYVLLYLLMEWFSDRRDAQLRFLKEENRILRSRLSQERLIVSPEERSRLLVIGVEVRY